MFSARVIADAFLDHIRYSGSVVQFLISSVNFSVRGVKTYLRG